MPILTYNGDPDANAPELPAVNNLKICKPPSGCFTPTVTTGDATPCATDTLDLAMDNVATPASAPWMLVNANPLVYGCHGNNKKLVNGPKGAPAAVRACGGHTNPVHGCNNSCNQNEHGTHSHPCNNTLLLNLCPETTSNNLSPLPCVTEIAMIVFFSLTRALELILIVMVR